MQENQTVNMNADTSMTQAVGDSSAVPTVVPATDQQPKTNNFLVILLSVLLFASVLIAGFFAFQTQKLVNELTMLKTEEKIVSMATTEPTTESVDTTNWKTYINTAYKYSFKFPSDYKISEIGGGQSTYTDDYLATILDLSLVKGKLQLLQISASPVDNTTLVDVVNHIYEETLKSENTSVVQPLRKVDFLGNESYSYVTSGKFHKTLSTEGFIDTENTHEFNYIWFENNNIRYVILITSDVAGTEQILSTFKFTN